MLLKVNNSKVDQFHRLPVDNVYLSRLQNEIEAISQVTPKLFQIIQNLSHPLNNCLHPGGLILLPCQLPNNSGRIDLSQKAITGKLFKISSSS